MIVKKKLNVSADAYFDILARYLLKDLRHTVGKKVKASEIKAGYTFTKKYKLPDDTMFTSKQVIEEYDYGKAYRLSFAIPQGTQIVGHKIQAIDDEHCMVEYEEKIISDIPAQKFRNVTGALNKKKQMNKILEMLEAELMVR